MNEMRAVQVRHTTFPRDTEERKAETKREIPGQILEEHCEVLGEKEKNIESN